MPGEDNNRCEADTMPLVMRAFDRAWERLCRSEVVGPYNKSRVRRMMAEQLTYWVNHGERDEWRLTRRAIFHVCYVERVVLAPAAYVDVAAAG